MPKAEDLPGLAERDAPTLSFDCQVDWRAWLELHHLEPTGIWLRFSKKASGIKSVSYPEALETALCFGWIDGQKRSLNDKFWLQKFTPRRRKSGWSKINRIKALLLIEQGLMRPKGLQEVTQARADGRWEAAYDSPRTAVVPPDLQAALNANPKAKEFFATLDSRNRYAILYRVQTVKKAETRARRIDEFIALLARHKTIHPLFKSPGSS